jgi:aminoglycoside 6-adenylyltransferase
MVEVDTMLDKIVEWGAGEAAVRALLLMGSRAAREPADHLADLDVGVFATSLTPYLTDDTWIGRLARPWVYSPDRFYFHDTVVPTRLVIYEGGTKVDYSFWSLESVERLAAERYFDTGYTVLLDKDGTLQQLGRPSFAPTMPPRPSEQAFVRLINEYWFEAYHVAKYLYRGDLWLVKFRDSGSLKVYLLTLMEWYELTKHGWDHDVKWTGKHIRQWLEPEVYGRLGEVFAHFDAEDSWKALLANNALFRDLADRTARLLGYRYPADVAENLTLFIRNLYDNHPAR